MLKPIHYISCSPALAACQRLMQSLALWLVEPATTAASITQQNMQPPTFASAIEANWLWDFLQCVDVGQTLLSRAQTLASMQATDKNALRGWVQVVSASATQFHPNPVTWPIAKPSVATTSWQAFKALMEAFYEKGLRSGLPYQADGTPVAVGGIDYAHFVTVFRDSHRLNPDPNAREVCALCGGPLGQKPHVDHWITKSAYPLLSICADNLLPICDVCNEAPNKGEKKVFSANGFADWFHPYLRPAYGAFRLEYALPESVVKCTSTQPADQPKADNLNTLLNLSSRWTREFKAEYTNQLEKLRRSRNRGHGPNSITELQIQLQKFCDDLVPSEPHSEVHQVLAQAMLDPARVNSWQAELGLV